MLGRCGSTSFGLVGFVGSLCVCSGRREQADADATASTSTTPQRRKPDQRMAGTAIIQSSLAPVFEQRSGQGVATGYRGLRALRPQSPGEGLTVKAHRAAVTGTPARGPARPACTPNTAR